MTEGTALAAQDDGELLRLVRAGQDAAFGELFARHAGAVRRYAMRCCTDVADAEDMAAEAFFRVFQAVRRGAGPDDNVRGYLLTVVRRLAAEWSVRKRDVPVADDELGRQVDAGHVAPASRADLQLIARAFTTLPTRWRAVLWRVEVEGERPAVVAPHFGLSANATAALARRARQGLRAAYLQAHLAPTGGATGCRSVVAKLGGFTAGQVTGAEAAKIRQHLAGCASCRALHAELLDVCEGLRRYAGSVGPGLAGAGLGVHHVLTGHLAAAGARLKLVAAAGARLKLVVAALSMAAVGGAGVVAGPLISHIDASPNADRGIVVAPAPATSASVPGPVLHRISGAFEPTIRTAAHGYRTEGVGPALSVVGTPLTSTGTGTEPVVSAVSSGALQGVQPVDTMQTLSPDIPSTDTQDMPTLSMQLLPAGPPPTSTDAIPTDTAATGRPLPGGTPTPSVVPTGP
jgi:RNA polymerase sigma factor (sigma-70 family)